MAERTNDQKGNNGRMAVISITERGEPMEDRITDALADILHYAKSCGLDPRALIERAMRHHLAESNAHAKDPGAI